MRASASSRQAAKGVRKWMSQSMGSRAVICARRDAGRGAMPGAGRDRARVPQAGLRPGPWPSRITPGSGWNRPGAAAAFGKTNGTGYFPEGGGAAFPAGLGSAADDAHRPLKLSHRQFQIGPGSQFVGAGLSEGGLAGQHVELGRSAWIEPRAGLAEAFLGR